MQHRDEHQFGRSCVQIISKAVVPNLEVRNPSGPQGRSDNKMIHKIGKKKSNIVSLVLFLKLLYFLLGLS